MVTLRAVPDRCSHILTKFKNLSLDKYTIRIIRNRLNNFIVCLETKCEYFPLKYKIEKSKCNGSLNTKIKTGVSIFKFKTKR